MKKQLTLLISIFAYAVVSSVYATGEWIGVGENLVWDDPANWQDGNVGGGEGTTTFKQAGTVTFSTATEIAFQNLYAIGGHVNFANVPVNLYQVPKVANVFNVEKTTVTLNAPITTTNGIIKRGSGALYLNAQNNISGGIYLQGGTLGIDQTKATNATGSNNFIPKQIWYIYPSIDLAYLRFNPLNANGGLQEIQQLNMSAPLTVSLSGSKFVFVPYELVGSSGLTMDGTGTLKTRSNSSYIGKVILNDKVRLAMNSQNYINVRLSEVNTNSLVFHVDASETDTLTLDGDKVLAWSESPARKNICSWSETELNEATPAGVTQPRLLKGALNGLDVVDLGEPVSDGGMIWKNSVDNIRTLVMLIGSQEGGGTLLGTKEPNANYIFARGADMFASHSETRPGNKPIYDGTITKDFAILKCVDVEQVQVWVNGTKINAQSSTALSGGYDIVVIKSLKADASASAFSRVVDGITSRVGKEGGQRIAEVMAYSTILDDQMIRHLHQYLSQKWLKRDCRGYGVPYLEYLCDKTDHNTADSLVYLPSDSQYSLPAPFRFGMFTQENTCDYFTVLNQTLTFEQSEWAKKIRLMDNSAVVVTARQISRTCPVAGAVLHVDANTNVIQDDGGITKWLDAEGGSSYACANIRNKGAKPTLKTNILNGMNVVDFGNTSSAQHLMWDTNRMVRAAFYVMKVTNHHVSFLGSVCPEMSVLDHFTRYNNATNYLFGAAQDGVMSGICRINGTRVLDPKNHLLPYDQFVVYAQTFDAPQMANAFGCGALQDSNLRADRTGGLQLAEVLIYDRPLTDDESLDIQAYLLYKWFNQRMVGYALPDTPYTIPAVGAGRGATFRVNGKAPTQIDELFGGANMYLTAPDTYVSLPVPQGNVILNNAKVFLRNDVAKGKIITNAGTTNSITGTGMLSALDVNGTFTCENAICTNITTLTFANQNALILGTNLLDCHSLTLGDNFEVSTVVNASSYGHAQACEGQVLGTGTLNVTLTENTGNISGAYPILSFGTLDATSQANLQTWQLNITGYDEKLFTPKLRFTNNQLSVVLAAKGMSIVLR